MAATKQTTRNNATLHNLRRVFNAAYFAACKEILAASGEKACRDFVGKYVRNPTTVSRIFSGENMTADAIFAD